MSSKTLRSKAVRWEIRGTEETSNDGNGLPITNSMEGLPSSEAGEHVFESPKKRRRGSSETIIQGMDLNMASNVMNNHGAFIS